MDLRAAIARSPPLSTTTCSKDPTFPDVGDGFVAPNYRSLPERDLSYARAWARKVIRWRRDPETFRRPPPFNPPSGRLKAGYMRRMPRPGELGIPPRKTTLHPLRLDLVPPDRWRRIHPDTRALILEMERELAAAFPPRHPAHEWVVPPRLSAPAMRAVQEATVDSDLEDGTPSLPGRPQAI